MKFMLFHFELLCLYFTGTKSQCTYPSDLNGVFYSSHEGFLTWNSSSFGSITITTITETFSNLEFECFLNSGNYYVGRSGSFTIFTAEFYAYICLELNRISSNVYYYHYGTTELSGTAGSRVKILPIATSVTTTADVCNEPTPYPDGSFSILYRNGTDITGEASTCPSDVQGYYTYTLDDGSTTHCANDSYLDVCTDTTKLTFDYTRCNATNVMYSASGDLRCLYYQTSGSLHYVIMYNNDVTVDDSSTYRTVCMLFEKGAGNTNYATQFPKECANATSMNSTAVISPGASLVLTLNDSCPVSTTTTTTTTSTTITPVTEAQTAVATGSIVGGVMATLLVIAAIVLIIIGVMLYKKKKAGKVDKADDKENIIPNGHAETNTRTHFHPAAANAGKEAASRTLFTPPNQVPSEDGDVLSDRHITLTQNSVDTLDEAGQSLADEYGEIQADEIMIVSEKTTMSMGAMTEVSLPMYSNTPTPPPTGTSNPTVVVEDIDAKPTGTGTVNTARSETKGVKTAKSDAKGSDTARSTAKQVDTARSNPKDVTSPRSEKNTARSEKNTPRTEKNTPKSEKNTPRSEKNTPRTEKNTPRDEKSPRGEKKSPREEKKSPRAEVKDLDNQKTDHKEVETPKTETEEIGTPRVEPKEVGTPRTEPKEVGTPRTEPKEVDTPKSEAKKPPVKKPRGQKK